MKQLLLTSILLIFHAASFKVPSSFFNIIRQQNNQKGNLKDELKYNGKGFGPELSTVFSDAINDASIYYKDKYFFQSNYISKQLKAVKPGDWHIILVQDLNISKITQISPGFSYWNENDTWAFWYNTNPYAKQVLHLAIYNGNSDRATNNVSTKDAAQGSNIDPDKLSVIDSIVQSLNNAQDIAKYIGKFDKQKWSVLAIPFSWGGKFPEAYATLSAGDEYVSYHGNVTFDS